jgi:myosin heavy subunit
MKMVHYYRGKKKNEVPPHLYLVADTAYSCMVRGNNIIMNKQNAYIYPF